MLIGLDIGEKRVGVALSDSSEMLATPFTTYQRTKGAAEKAVKALVEERDIKLAIVGLPLSSDGQKTKQCEDVENFCRRLAKRVAVEIIYVDEYLTSEEAKERLGISGSAHKKLREKGVIDAMSASIILQSFIDTRQEKNRRH